MKQAKLIGSVQRAIDFISSFNQAQEAFDTLADSHSGAVKIMIDLAGFYGST